MIARCGGDCIHARTIAAGAARAPAPQPIVSPILRPEYPAARMRSLTIARKLARRSYHALRELGPAAPEPIATS